MLGTCHKSSALAMKAFIFLAFTCLGAVSLGKIGAQTPPPKAPVRHTPPAPAPPAPSAPAPSASATQLPDLADETVVAKFDDGTTFTMGDFKKYYQVLTPQNQQMALRDRSVFLHQWALFRKLAREAEEHKLDQQSPYKEAAEYARMQVLIQARINEAVTAATVEPAEVQSYYDGHQEKYKQVRLKAIYIPFGEAAGAQSSKVKKPLTEDEAKAKATKLLAEIRAGADFVKLVKDNSEDATSKAKDGEFATLQPSDNVPDAFRGPVFALKKGEVTEPLRQAGGFYLLRAEEITYRPLAQVRDEISEALRQQRYTEWFDKINRDTKVEIVNPAFLGNAPAAAGK
jgi:peptidyl-prolyl cis-trans isomerase C